MDSRLNQGRALPTFFIIGAPAAGTTSLHYYLDQHPEIQMSAVKEPRFFAPHPDPLNPPNTINAKRRISHLGQYEQLFDTAVKVRGEASVDYANYPRREGVPERIKQLVPEAKFIYLVRDPIARTLSHYQHRVAVEGERRSLREALGDHPDPSSICICPSLYASQLGLYLDHFSQESILVIDQADLLSDRRSTLGGVFAFLSVDDRIDSSRFEEELGSNRERRIYPPGYARLRGPVVPAPLRWIPRGIRRPLRRSMEQILWPPLKPPILDDELRARLEALYAGEVERLRALTGKTFSTWSI